MTACHIGWADLIFCMERKHADRLRERFAEELDGKPLITLRVPDEFQRDDPALIALLRTALAAHVTL